MAKQLVRIAEVAGRPLELRYYENGKRRRKSTGTYDEAEAEQLRAELEAKLTLGLKAETRKGAVMGLDMPWDEFRNEYQRLHLDAIEACTSAEYRINLAGRILGAKTLRDVAENLGELQKALLLGHLSKRKRPRSSATVRSYMRAVIAALNWGRKQGWYPDRFDVALISVEESEDMKGRPLVGEEFDRMLVATEKVVGEEAADSWKAILNALRNSGLRLSELMSLTWDSPQTIHPIWRKGRLPVLWIPGSLQKNRKAQEIPLCPWFEEQLLQTPSEARSGFVFNPVSLAVRLDRRPRFERLSPEAVGKVISRIGKKAGIIVDEGNRRTGAPEKYASAHDLRRTFAMRLADAGLSASLTRKLMRHADIRTTERYYLTQNVQKDAGRIRELLAFDAAGNSNRANLEPARS